MTDNIKGIIAALLHKACTPEDESRKNEIIRLVKFGLVGVSNTVISYAVYALLVRLQVHYQLAAVAGFSASVVNAFFWNNRFVFKKEKDEHRSVICAFVKTLLSYAGTGLVLANALLYIWVGVLGVSEYIAPVINLFITIPLNYLLNKFWAFRKKRSKDRGAVMKNSVITGCTGAVGQALIRELIASGQRVTALVNPESGRLSSLPKSDLLNIEKCDMGHYSELRSVSVGECESFYHLAWQGSSGEGRNDAALQNKNLEASLDAVRLAARLGCKVFVFAGSQAEYGAVPYGVKLKGDTPCNPLTEYGKYKLRAGLETRKLCEKLGIKHIYVRILSVYGPFDTPNSMVSRAVCSLEAGVNPQYTAGEQIWDFLWSADAANALVLLSRYGSGDKIYPIGSGEGRPLREYIEVIHRVVNPALAPVFGEVPYAQNQVMYLCADITELTRDTGFVPETAFESGIRILHEMGQKP